MFFKVLILVDNMNLRLYLSSADRLQRYLPFLPYLKGSILDVGGGTGVLYDLSKRKDITIFDINEEELEIASKKGLKTVKGDASKLPFKDGSFDTVISVATLEHIPKEKRNSFLDELIRVSKKWILIYTPYGETGEKYDKKIYSLRKKIGREDKWTLEHIQNGLPRLEELRNKFPNAKIKKIQNAQVWYFLMILQSIPILNKILPGIAYFVLKPIQDREPTIGLLLFIEK